MFKKFTSMLAVSTLLAAAGLVLTAPASNATDISQKVFCVTSNPMPSMSAASMAGAIRNDNFLSSEWNVGVPTWSPSLSGTFATNTVYSATVTLTAAVGTFKFNNLSANAFTANPTCAGASSITSITAPAVSAGANLSSIDVTITFANTGSGGGGGGGGTHVIATTSTIAGGAVNPTVTITTDAMMQAMPTGYNILPGTTGLTLWGINTGTPNTAVLTFHGTAASGTLTIQVKASGFAPTASADSNTLSIVITGGSTPLVVQSAAQVLAAAEALRAAAEAKRAAVISEARATLISTITSGKPATFDQLAKSNFKVIDAKSMEKVNAAIAKLDANSSDFNAKLAEAVEKINYTDTFFDPKQPATKEAVAAYGVNASDFALKLINSESAKAGIEKLPDFAAMKELINKVTIVEKVVAPTATTSLSTGDLIRANLITTETKYKTTVLSGLKSSGASISSVADLEAAIKAQEKLAADRYARTRAIVAKIASNK
jgi:hypothetical protein